MSQSGQLGTSIVNSNSNVSGDDDSKNQTDSLSIFCREVRNLLRSKPSCMIPFSKFVPAYHNHYGRQCCVYQFGYTKLIELLESIPHVVQIVGDGTNRYITLTHREQIKRFASDLIKVVKSQPGKKLKLSQFARAYEQALGRVFKVEDYGTNNINVLLAEIWEGTINIMPIKRDLVEPSVTGPLFVGTNTNSSSVSAITDNNDNSSLRAKGENCALLNQLVINNDLVNKPYITEQYPDAWFEIPKRERSEKEIKRTKYFIWDVIELLCNMEPDYSVPFSKFIPSYHYYFNRQCKVSIFGFSKLIDLFESISPDVVEIIDQGPGEEKIIKLSEQHVPLTRRNRQAYRASLKEREIDITDDRISPGESISSNALYNYHQYYGSGSGGTGSATACEDYEDDGCKYDDDQADDMILPAQAIDNGPTEEELAELEDELKAYEELKTIQSKRSSRMAAILDIFKYPIY